MKNIANDDGFFNNKIVTSDFNKFLIPTSLCLGEAKQKSLLGDGDEYSIYSTVNDRYEIDNNQRSIVTVGDIKNPTNCDFKDYPISFQSRVMVYHALIKIGMSDHDVRLLTSLPVNRYYKDGSVNQTLVDEKNKNLQSFSVECVNKTIKMPKIKQSEVLPEAVSAWYDYVITEKKGGYFDLNEELLSHDIAVCDIGGRTTDIAVISEGEIDHQKSTSIDAGMLDVKNTVKRNLIKDLSIHEEELSGRKLTQILASGFIDIDNNKKDVKASILSAKQDLVDNVSTFLDRSIGSARLLNNVLFVGGGAVALEDVLKKARKNAIFPDDPLFSNALGMQKYAMFVDPISP